MNELIFNEMTKLLEEYEYTYDDEAISGIIDEWESRKAPLIEMFKRHPNYIEGKFLIAFDTNYEREIDADAVFAFRCWLRNTSNLITLPDDIKAKKENPDMILPNDIYTYLADLHLWCNNRTIDEEHAKKLGEILPEIHPHAGQKTSRVINRFCNYLGWSKLPEYNREYAKFADALSPLTIKRHTILSINPLDFLTMSFGNSWASCHTIDKENKRGMPNSYQGQYSSGTISYMLDSTSMVLYTVDAAYDGTDYWTQPKIIRQMFHWGEDKLIQSRLYPQSNDCDGEAYTPYRNIVQAIMAQVQDIPNLWTMKRGRVDDDIVNAVGTHYRDYFSFENTTLSRPKGVCNERVMTIGAHPICIECGCRHYTEDNISCCDEDYVCASCGEHLSRDDVCWVGDMPYCNDCVTWCDICATYEPNANTTWIESENRYVCNYCLERYYTRCDECDEWYHNDNVCWVESAERYVCDDCINELYTRCDNCEEFFPNTDIHHTIDGDLLCDNCLIECAEEEEDA